MDKDRALGLLIDALATVAFDYTEMNGGDAFDLLEKAGLLGCRPATDEDAANGEFVIEVGDDWYFLTDEAKALRRAATHPEAPGHE